MRRLLILIMLLALVPYVAADSINYTTTGSWQAPTGVSSVQVELWGGGGSGGGGNNANADGGGGGAGGQYVIANSVPVTAGTNYTITIGSGGTGVGKAVAGNVGGDTWFNSTTTALAKGGAGGQRFDDGAAGGAGTVTGGVGDTVYRGGTGGDGSGTNSGGGGGGAGTGGHGGNGTAEAQGTGTASGGGDGGAGTTSNSAAGAAGSDYGGGAGGSTKNGVGGNGGAGLISLTWTPNDPPDVTTAMTANASVDEGEDVIFNITASDPENDDYRLTVCDAIGITDGYPGVCSGGSELCNSTATSDDAASTCTYTTSTPGTVTAYGYVCDAGGMSCTGYNQTSTTVTDITAPVITNIQNSSIDNESAYISWDTDDSTNGTIEWGETLDLGNFEYNTTMLTSRNFSITGLNSSTTYYYNVTSCNSDDLCQTNGSNSFTTAENDGTLAVTLVDPTVDTNVTQNQLFNFTVNVTCSGGACGHVNVTLQHNETIMSTSGGANPFYTTDSNPQNGSDISCLLNMQVDTVCQITWSVNATGSVEGTHDLFAFANSTNVSVNAVSSNIDATIKPLYGALNVSISSPIDATEVSQYENFTINATVVCAGEQGAVCGEVTALARYNASTASADTDISITAGATPMYLVGNLSSASYTGFNFSVITEVGRVEGVCFNGTNFFVLDMGSSNGDVARVYEYDLSGSYTGFNFSVDNEEALSVSAGLACNGTNYYMVSGFADRIFEYDNTGSYTGFNFSVNTQESSPAGVSFNGTNFYVVGTGSDRVFEYNLSGDYTGFNFSVLSEAVGVSDLYFNGTSFFVLDLGSTDGDIARIYEYNLSGDYTGFNFSVEDQNSMQDPGAGLTFNGSNFYMAGQENDRVYEYLLTTLGENLKSCGTLNQGESCNIGWEVNYTDAIGSSYEVDVIFNSTTYLDEITANDTEDRTVQNPSAGPDTSPPVISAVDNSTRGADSVTITWSTDDSSNTSVEYGTSVNLGTFSEVDDSTTSHSRSLSGLQTVTTYYYNVTSCNSDDYCNTTGPLSFATKSFGALNVSITLPVDSYNVTQNSIFTLNATVTCDGSDAVCGIVSATARYNSSSGLPDLSISNLNGATPLFIGGSVFIGDQKWNTSEPGDEKGNSVVVSPDGSTIYVTGPTASNDYITTALNSSTGVSIWNSTASTGTESNDIAVSPSGEVVYVTGYGGSPDYYTTALNSSNGASIWNSTDTHGFIAESIDVSPDGKVIYIAGNNGSSNQNMYAIALNSSDGTQLWNYTDERENRDSFTVDSSPDGSLVYVSGGYSGIVFALNSSTGGSIWNSSVQSINYAKVVASPDGSILYAAGSVFRTAAINASSGVLLWNSTNNWGGDCSGVTISSGGDILYLAGKSADNDYFIVAVNSSNGIQLWNHTDAFGYMAEGIDISPNDEIIYITGYNESNGYFYTIASYTSNNLTNPKSSSSLNYGDSFTFIWTVNATGTNNTQYYVDVIFNSTTYPLNITANDTEDRKVCIGECDAASETTDATGPTDATIVDRDSRGAPEDNTTLLVELSDAAAGVNVTFHMNLTDPTIGGQNEIMVGWNTTNASGVASLFWKGLNNLSSKMYAGNYTWWGEASTYDFGSSNYIYIYGGLNLTFRYSDDDPNSSYSDGDLILLDELLLSYGPETDTQLNGTYLAAVNTTLFVPNGTNYSIVLVDPVMRPSEIISGESYVDLKAGLFDNAKPESVGLTPISTFPCLIRSSVCIDSIPTPTPGAQPSAHTSKPGKGSSHTKTVECKGNKCTTTYSLGVVNYYDGKDFKRINKNIKKSSKQHKGEDYDYNVEEGLYKAYFKKDGKAAMTAEGATVTMQPVGLKVLTGSGEVTIPVSTPTINPGNNKLNYAGAFTDVDLIYTYESTRLKEELVLNNPLQAGDLVYSSIVVAENSDGTPMIIDTSSDSINFKDVSGKTIFIIPEMMAYDSNGSRIVLNKTLSMTAFGNLRIEIQVPFSWLNASSTLYPVYIDPTTVYNYTDETYIEGWECTLLDSATTPPTPGPFANCTADGGVVSEVRFQAEFDSLASPGGSRYQMYIAGNHEDWVLFNFSVQESAGSISRLNFSWLGYSATTGLDIRFNVWNYSAGEWDADCDVLHDGASDEWRSCSYTDGLTDMLNDDDNHAIFLVQCDRGGGGSNELCSTDYIGLEVYIADIDPPVISAVGNNTVSNETADINWTTDESSNSSVEYGTTLNLGTLSGQDDSVTSHGVLLSGLSNYTLYYYNVTSCDSGGYCNASGPYNFTTLQNDFIPPIISSVSSSSTLFNATVTWTTDEESNSSVNYGTSISLGTKNESNATVLEHSLIIPSLEYDTYYYYNVTSCDEGGNCNTSGPYNFTTRTIGTLSVNIISPSNSYSVSENDTFILKANVTCEGTNSICGVVEAIARYNSSSGSPNVNISSIDGDSPFYIMLQKDVTQFQYDNSRSGTIENIGPRDLDLIESYDTGGFVDTAPVVVDGVVYVGSNDNNLYALNASDMSYIDSHNFTGKVTSNPEIYKDKIYVVTTNNRLFSFNITCPGSLCLEGDNVTLLGSSTSALAIVDDIVYVAKGNDGMMYAINSTDLSSIANVSIGAIAVTSGTTVVDGAVYVGADDGKVHMLNASCPGASCFASIANFTTGGTDVSSTPTVVDGVVYVGSQDKVLYALNASDLSHIANYTTGLEITTSVAVANGIVYVGSNDLFALNATCPGSECLSFISKYDVVSSLANPVVVDDVVYTGVWTAGSRGWFVALDTNLSHISNYSFPTGYYTRSTAAVVGGVAYMGAITSDVYAFGLPIASGNKVPSSTLYSGDAFTASWNVNMTASSGTYYVDVLFNSTTYPDNISSANTDDRTVCVNNCPLIISGVVNYSISNESAIINWTTNLVANSSVNYGTTTNLGTVTGSDSDVTAHSVSISNLENNTLYYYNVTNCDSGDNCVVSGPYSFSTLTVPITSRYYVQSGSDTNLPNLNLTQDTTQNSQTKTLASTTFYNYINASVDISDITIAEGSVVNFSSYWNDGSRIDTVYATYKLFNGSSNPANLICASGNDGVVASQQLPDGTTGLVTGGCVVSSDFAIGSTGGLHMILNVYASGVGTGGGGGAQDAQLIWDDGTADTWVEFTYYNNSEAEGAPDTSPPVISAVVNYSISNVSAIVNWTTDEPSNSSVNYGTSVSLGTLAGSDSDVSVHSVSLSSLTNGTTYYYNVTSCDSGDYCNVSGPYSFTTDQNDATAPVISAIVNYSITNVSAIINWTTDEGSNSSVNYGDTINMGTLAGSDSDVSVHSVSLSSLTNGTTYYYNVTSCDSGDYCNTSGPFNFTTLQNTDTIPPVISAVVNYSITNVSAVINWTTDEGSNSSVNYGDSINMGTLAGSDSDVTVHSVALSSLTNGTVYYYNVTSCDSGDYCNTSGPFNFTTLQNDASAPVISAVVNYTITNESVIINWTTDEASNSSVDYGTNSNLGTLAGQDDSVTTHSVSISSLTNNTQYFYNVSSCDAVGNCAVETTLNFTTLQNSDTSPPVISSVINYSITNVSAIINWTTDEPSNSSVNYGTSVSLGTLAGSDSDVSVHSVSLSSLTNGTKYYYNVTSCDSGDYCNTSGPFNFTTLQNDDLVDPVISNVLNDSITNVSVVVGWTTDELANGTVEYGTDTDLGSFAYNTTLLLDRNVSLSGLINGTLYYYNVTSCDDAATPNCNTSGPFSFTTDQNTDTTPPVISAVVNYSITNVSAIINWTTDEGSNSSVEYGTTTNLGTLTGSDSDVTIHSVSLSSLINGTTYYYNVTSCDSGDYCNVSGPYSFTTDQNVDPDSDSPSITPTAPVNKSGNDNGNVTFNFTVSDVSAVTNCSLYLNNTFNVTNTSVDKALAQSFVLTDMPGKKYPWYVSCTDSAGNSGNSGQRRITVMKSNGYSTVSDTSGSGVETYSDFYIGNSFGNFTWSGNTDLSEGGNLERDLYLEQNIAGLDAERLPDLNKSVFVNLLGLSYQFTPLIYRNGEICTSACELISYSAGTGVLYFNVSGFSNYTSGNNAYMNIYDDTDSVSRYLEDDIFFFANYTNVTSEAPINGTGVWCSFSENSTGSWSTIVNMTYNASNQIYYFNKTFATAGSNQFNVTCNGSVQNYESLVGIDAFAVSSGPKHWNNSFNTTDETAGVWNVSTNAVAKYFISESLDLVRNFTLTGGTDTSPPIITTVVNYSITNVSAVINWTTDDSSNSSVDYGDTINMGTLAGSDSDVTVHSVALSSLTNGTVYYYNVTSCNSDDYCNTSGPFNFTTLQNYDLVDPIISNVLNDSITNVSAIVGWTTDELANGTVEYGTDTDLGSFAYNTTLLLDRNVSLSGLTNGTLYYYNVTSCDDAATPNCNTSGPFSFTTLQNDASAPVITAIVNYSTTNVSSIVNWTTNEASNSSVNYGTTIALGTLAGSDSDVTVHSVALSSLTNGTVYYYNVTSCDAVGNCQTNGSLSFTTDQNDASAPVISGIVNWSITNESVIINWTTNEASNSTVYYGTSASLGQVAGSDSDVTTHSISLSSLTNGTIYYYNVSSCDSENNCAVEATLTFTTDQNDASAPVITNVENSSIDNESAYISWNTDESANGTIEYGTDLDLGTFAYNTSMLTTRNVSITGLDDNTLYYYNLTSCDSVGNCQTNGSFSFTTDENIDGSNPVVTPDKPNQGAGDHDGNITFNFTVSDASTVNNCSIYIDNVYNQTNTSVNKAVGQSFDINNMPAGVYLWNASCTDDSGNSGWTTTRRVTVVITSSFTTVTDLSEEDTDSVSNFYVANSFGNITWPDTSNLTGAFDLNSYIYLQENLVGINPGQLANLNKSARLAIFGLGYGHNPALFRNGVACGSFCMTPVYDSGEGVLTFNVTEFSNYTTSNNSQMLIYDDTDSAPKLQNESILFTANYTNTTSEAPINGTDVWCSFTENSTGSWSAAVNMTYNGTTFLYNLSKSFENFGTFAFNVTCNGSAQDYEVLYGQDAFTVTEDIKFWNGSFNTSGRTTGTWNVSVNAQVPFFYTESLDDTRNFTLSGENNPPSVDNVSTDNPIQPATGTTVAVEVNFSVTDADGLANLNDTSASAKLIKDSITRSGSCSATDQDSDFTYYNCTVLINYYDLPGSWTVNVSIQDNSALSDFNDTTTTSVNNLFSIVLDSATYDFGTLSMGATVAGTDNPIIVNNQGNLNASTLNITGFALAQNAYVIGAGNLTVNITNAEGTSLINNTELTIPNAFVSPDTDSTEVNQSLYFYITTPSGILPGTYTSQSDWVIKGYE